MPGLMKGPHKGSAEADEDAVFSAQRAAGLLFEVSKYILAPGRRACVIVTQKY